MIFIKHFSISPLVFYPTAILSILFVVIVLMIGAPAAEAFSVFQKWMSNNLGWFVTIAINCYLLFVIYVAFGKYGTIRLGGPDAKPEFSKFSWVAMLFSAGMGIGLLYFSVAEPMFHFNNPISTEYDVQEKVQYAMNITFLHYGLHVWGIYCLVGLTLAYYCFNQNKPLSIGATIEHLLPKKFKSLTKLVDVIAALATLFGLATSLGFGARQFCAGLEEIFGISNVVSTQVTAIIAITFIATISIITGLKKGVKILSNLNIIMATILFFFVLFTGPTIKLLNFFVDSTGTYLSNIVNLGFERGVMEDNAGFYKSWNMFYWAWWISWSPFVGTFIARISRGRTLKEFVLYVLFLPSFATFLWMGVFGGLAFDLQLNQGIDLAGTVSDDSSKALFVLLRELPLAKIISFLSIMLVATFFITSSDSGSLVVDYMTSGGKLDAPTGQKIFWASMEGALAIALIIGGGLSALQAASISTGFPFAIFILIMAWGLYKSFITTHKDKE